MVKKIREVDTRRIFKKIVYKLDEEDIRRLKESIVNVFNLYL